MFPAHQIHVAYHLQAVKNIGNYYHNIEVVKQAELDAKGGLIKKDKERLSKEISMGTERQVLGLKAQDMNDDGYVTLDEFLCWRACTMKAVEREKLLRTLHNSVSV